MKLRLIFLSTLLVFVSANIKAQIPDPTLPEFEWLIGYWTSEKDGNKIEELWTNGAGYMMLGVHRNVYANGRSSFEYLRIMRTRDGIVYIAHPNGSTGTTFKMKEHSDQKVIFENPENDFPTRIIYSRKGDQLTARIEDETGEKSMEWMWKKSKPKL